MSYLIFGIFEKVFTNILLLGIFKYMTIKTRNRLNIIFSAIALIILLINLSLLIYNLVTKNFSYPEIYFQKQYSSNFLLRFNPVFVILGIFFLLLYTLLTSIALWLGFEKTQSSEIIYILLFLASFLFDSARFLISIFYSKAAYSSFLFALGNCVLLSRILAPLSLVSLNIFVSEEERQNTERNILMLFVTATFFTICIPINTAIVFPNFSISYSFSNTLFATSVVINIITIFIYAVSQYKNNSSQILTLGYAMLCFGYLIMFNCTNLIRFILGSILMSVGTIFYINSLHNRYMWEM